MAIFNGWERLRSALLNPAVDDARLETALREARARQPLPVIWLLGKTQAGKTSIIRALTGSPSAQIGNGFQPCTRTASFYDFPPTFPIVRFLDTRGLGEVAYDPSEDLEYCQTQAHLVLGVMKALDIRQTAVLEVLRSIRQRHPQLPVLIAQTGLHEGYAPSDAHVQPYSYAQTPWSPQVPHTLSRALLAQREQLGVLPGTAPVRWIPIDLTLPEDGWEPLDYGLEALWTAIGEVSALSWQMRLRDDAAVLDVYARSAHPQIVAHSLAAAGIGAMPLLDWVGVPAIQAKLLHSLATIYQQSWGSRQIAEFIGLLGAGIGVGYLARLLGRSAAKLTPVWGQSLGAMWGATASAATTYALGKTASAYFLSRHHGHPLDAAALRHIYSEALAAGATLLYTKHQQPPHSA